jgi:DNA helicase-2/ATP-dependent DNA helicase PcrA
VNDFLDHFYLAHLEANYENAEERADDVQEVAAQIGQSASVEAFLQEVALLTNTDAADGDDSRRRADAVRLSTVHQAKGLEWPLVFIVWASEGMFPSSRSLGEVEDDTEERRLFYVATTRARDVLNICIPEWRQTRDGQAFNCRPSRFVAELPDTLLRARYGLRF